MTAGQRRRLGAVALFVLAGGCSASSSDGAPGSSTPGRDQPTTTTAPTAKAAAFNPQACWWPVAGLPATVTVTCGTIDVPANHGDPRSKTLTLAVARLHDSRSRPEEPPIVNPHGGPGGDALSTAPTADSLPLAAIVERDLILYDQRGSGRSTPSLNCPEKEEAVLNSLSMAGTWKQEFGANEAAVKACRKRLVGLGVDPNDYDTLASVADLETIRRAFGVNT